FSSARQAMADAVAKLEPRINGGRYAAMLNNLGGTTELEMSILSEDLRRSSIGARISHIVGPASMMTALDMHGFSLTLYALEAADEALLAAATPLRGWPGLRTFVAPQARPLPEGLSPLHFMP